MRRRLPLALALAALALALAGVGAGVAATPTLSGAWRGKAAATKDKVKVQVGKTGKVRFTYACHQDKAGYVYHGRARRGRFDLVRHSATLPKVVVAEVTGRVSARRAHGTVQQDVCAGAVEHWSARR